MNKSLRNARKSKGVSMTYMAKKLGYKSVSGYANIEYGITKPSLENAVKISEMLDVSLDELFFEEKLHNTSNKVVS
ncbi:helix-turn-helix transcriptional regulator [Psychrobacillus sp. NEAU-3TGS]|uniref:helix-turn-helix transcriptional regulator n=1 Tax=Psychrobacillus sp. NEAU-3TGS TaxID=2995412 RepID=UPI00249608DE|nr:helix-turn-helix transcriptional regulator [Psychrobacillus sp. NEAU-3TGS]MDI2588091.1 helix-turn-helix transcriptional regulator [Psychrobacillus sp. NEAU-3TGS]